MFGYLLLGLAGWFGYKWYQEKHPAAPQGGTQNQPPPPATVQNAGILGIFQPVDVIKVQNILATWAVNTGDGASDPEAVKNDPMLGPALQQMAAMVRAENGTMGANTIQAMADFQRWAQRNGKLDPSVPIARFDTKTQAAIAAYGASVGIS